MKGTINREELSLYSEIHKWTETFNVHSQRFNVLLLVRTIFGSPCARFHNFRCIYWFIHFNHLPKLVCLHAFGKRNLWELHLSTCL